jgi:hypothetical protein
MTEPQVDCPAMGWKKNLALDAAIIVAVWVVFGLWYYHREVYGEWGWQDLPSLFLAPLWPAIIFSCQCQRLVCRPGVAPFLWVAGLGLLPVAFVAQFVGRRGWIWTVLGAASVAIWWGFGTWYVISMNDFFNHWTAD